MKAKPPTLPTFVPEPRRGIYRSSGESRTSGPIPKPVKVRSKKLTDLAHRVHACTLKLPGVCIGYSHEGCEPAHANLGTAGKGGALKANDHQHAAACHACHVELDQGKRFTKTEKEGYWRVARDLTLQIYFTEGWLIVK